MADDIGGERTQDSVLSPRVIALVEVNGGKNRRPLVNYKSWPLLWSLTRQQLITRYRQSALQLAWIVIQPVAFMIVYAFFFHGVLQVDSGKVPYLSFVAAGLIPWRFISIGLNNTTSITDSIHLISKAYFPKELIPLSGVLAGTIDLLIGTIVLFTIVLVEGGSLSYHVIGLPFAYLLLLLSTATVSIFLSAVAVFIRDVAHMMTLISIGVFFATPIMYQADQLPTWLQWFPAINPFAIAISNVRDLVLFGRWFSVTGYLIHLAVAATLFLGSLAYVRSIEARMVDVA